MQIIVITAMTPKTTPSTLKNDRSLFRPTEQIAVLKKDRD
jgi:hypothetical protein